MRTAYDDEALGFLKGDVLIIEEKTESGNWRGRLVKKTIAVAGGKTFEYSKTGGLLSLPQKTNNNAHKTNAF